MLNNHISETFGGFKIWVLEIRFVKTLLLNMKFSQEFDNHIKVIFASLANYGKLFENVSANDIS